MLVLFIFKMCELDKIAITAISCINAGQILTQGPLSLGADIS